MGKYDGLTRHISAAVENRQPKPSFLSVFFGKTDVHGESIVKFDKRDYTNGIAPFVQPMLEGKPITVKGFNNYLLELPTMKPSKILTSDDLQKRPFGQSEDSAISKNARARELANTAVDDNEDRIDVRLEVMRAEALFNASLTISGEGYDSTITFPRDLANTVVLGTGNYWDEATQDAEKDVLSFIQILGDAGRSATHIIGRNATIAILTKLVKSSTDYRKDDNAALKVNSMLLVNGAIYYGTYLGLEMWGYDGNYTNETGSTTKAIPAKKIVVLALDNNNEMSFGYAGDVSLELGLVDSYTISPRNVITKLHGTKSSVEIESVLTAAPLLKDGNATLVATVLS